jgi:di/tricarboxylate transporter
MTWEMIFVAVLVVAAVASFIAEKIPVDVTAITLFSVLLTVSIISQSPSLPSLERLLLVFANSAPLTIAAMFIISLALEKCGAIDAMTGFLGKTTELSYPLFLIIMTLGIAIVSAFVNNTPVVVVFLPVIMTLARKMNTPASKLLIPLSYASIFGGVCTLIGTSTNVLMSGIVQDQGMPPLGMFELASIGVPLLIICTLYMAFIGHRFLPVRETLSAILSEEERKEFITEAFVHADSRVIGRSLADTDLLRKTRTRVLEIVRDGVAMSGDARTITLKEGDRLVLACRPNDLARARQVDGINFLGEQGMGIEQIAAHEGALVEGVLGPNSSILGKTIEEINFRQRYRMILMAVHRQGRNVREQLGTLRFEFGDTLLMMGSDVAIDNLRRGEDIILLDRPPLPAADKRKSMFLVLGGLAAMVATVSLGILPIVVASILLVTVLLLTKVIQPKDAYRAIEWRLLILIYGTLGLGMAMESSGLTRLAAESLVGQVELLASPEWRPLIMLALMFAITSFLTEILSNNATVVLMAPIGLAIAVTLGVDARPFVIAICVAASASFSTPIGYQTNTYVYGVGGYRFGDFARVGIPLNLVYFAVSLIIIPFIWPFNG